MVLTGFRNHWGNLQERRYRMHDEYVPGFPTLPARGTWNDQPGTYRCMPRQWLFGLVNPTNQQKEDRHDRLKRYHWPAGMGLSAKPQPIGSRAYLPTIDTAGQSRHPSWGKGNLELTPTVNDMVECPEVASLALLLLNRDTLISMPEMVKKGVGTGKGTRLGRNRETSDETAFELGRLIAAVAAAAVALPGVQR